MNFQKSAFSIISVIFFLWILAIFVAGSLIFLNVQIYNSLYEAEGMWITLGLIIAEIFIFFLVFLFLIRKSFFNIFRVKEKAKLRMEEKAVLGFVVFEVLKYFYEKNRKKI